MATYTNKKLGTIFHELGLLDVDQEKAALAYGKKHGIPFGQACVKMGFLDDATVLRGLSMQMGAPSISIASITIPASVIGLIPAAQAEALRVIPVAVVPASGGQKKDTLLIAVSSPRNLPAVDELAFRTGKKVQAVVASDADIDEALLGYYGVEVGRGSRASTMIELDPGDEGSVELEVEHDRLRIFLPTPTPPVTGSR